MLYFRSTGRVPPLSATQAIRPLHPARFRVPYSVTDTRIPLSFRRFDPARLYSDSDHLKTKPHVLAPTSLTRQCGLRHQALCFQLKARFPSLSATWAIRPLHHRAVPDTVPYSVTDTHMLSAVISPVDPVRFFSDSDHLKMKPILTIAPPTRQPGSSPFRMC